MGVKIVDLAKRRPKLCPHCSSSKIVEKMWDWLCGDCRKCWPKLNRGQLYLKVWDDDK